MIAFCPIQPGPWGLRMRGFPSGTDWERIASNQALALGNGTSTLPVTSYNALSLPRTSKRADGGRLAWGFTSTSALAVRPLPAGVTVPLALVVDMAH